MMPRPADYWRANVDLREITPRGERFPEVGLFDALRQACVGSVFEFGCGDGRLAPAFDPCGYFGFDINPAALCAARVANPKHLFGDEIRDADTFLAHTVLLHVPDDELPDVVAMARCYRRIVISEVMGRKWRRAGNPPVFNREADEYAQAFGKVPRVISVPYPRYRCNLDMLVFDA